MTPDMVLYNGKITTLDKKLPQVSAMAIAEGKVLAIGSGDDSHEACGQRNASYRSEATQSHTGFK